MISRPHTIAIVGSSGMLGQEILGACLNERASIFTFADAEALDITDAGAVRRELRAVSPDVIVNAAAFRDVDGAEADADGADRVNHLGVRNLAEAAAELGAVLVHFSSDHVFDGESSRPYRVDDATNPVNAYGRSMAAGERAVRASGCEHLIVRTSWLFAPHGRNHVNTILHAATGRTSLDAVVDRRCRPTLCRDLAEMTCRLVSSGARGTVHAANGGDCTWYEFADAVAEFAGLSCKVRAAPGSAVPRPAARPRFSVLDLSSSIPHVGHPRHWRDALAECMALIAEETATFDFSRTRNGEQLRVCV